MKPFMMVLLLAGCASAAVPTTRVVTITPTVPDSLLQCAPAPDVPTASRQSVVARYIVALWQAGEDCRAHVAAIRQALTTP